MAYPPVRRSPSAASTTTLGRSRRPGSPATSSDSAPRDAVPKRDPLVTQDKITRSERSAKDKGQVMTTRELFSLPNPVNEKAARSVAGGVVLLAALTLGLSVAAGHGWLWMSAVLAYGFLARVLTGPTLSPLGQLATRFAAPRFGTANSVAGPPKRFVPESVNLYEALICTYY